MFQTMTSPFRVCLALIFFFTFGLSAAFASHPPDPFQDPPQAPPVARTAHKNYLSWNPIDLAFTGRVTIGYERLFRLGSRYYGLYVQYTSPMNTVFTGIVTGRQTPFALSDEIQFPSGVDVYLYFHGKGTTRT